MPLEYPWRQVEFSPQESAVLWVFEERVWVNSWVALWGNEAYMAAKPLLSSIMDSFWASSKMNVQGDGIKALKRRGTIPILIVGAFGCAMPLANALSTFPLKHYQRHSMFESSA